MNLRQLEVFVAAVDTGNLTEAGEVVGLTQSAVSYSLSKLEAELGVTLLERGRQGAAITRIGEEVLQHARSVLTQVDIIRQKTARERGLSVGKLRFGCVPTIPPQLLTGILRDFQHKFPDIEIVLFEGMPQELAEWLAAGMIDIGTVLVPEAYPLSQPLVHNDIICIVSPKNPLAKEPMILRDSLVDETLIGPKAEYGVIGNMAGLESLILPRTRHEVSAPTTIFAMVRENMGVSLMPEMLIDPNREDIVAIPIGSQIQMDVYLAARIHSPANEAFLNTACTWAREHGFLQGGR